jgi:transcription antitermination factor NusG
MFDEGVAAEWRNPRWYALFVRSNQEKRIAQQLSGRDIEHFLPCYGLMSQWRDRRVKLEVPLFPGYLFARLPFSERLKVLTIPNVVSLVGTRNAPSPISEEEIDWIRRGIGQGTAAPHSYLKIGQRVRITQGALYGLEGILLRTQNNTRIAVSVESISRTFTVEVDPDCVKPLDIELNQAFRSTRGFAPAPCALS